jgi:hypothetical protein
MYGWSKTIRNKPSEWKTEEITSNGSTASITLEVSGKDEEYYLWIKGGSIKDKKGYSNPTFATGPYSFLGTPTITYVSNNFDDSFNHTISGIIDVMQKQHVMIKLR